MSSKTYRQYDIVILGATGYTGALTAEHIAANLPTDLKWAVAGRSADKLQRVVDSCLALNPDRVQPTVEVCNANAEEITALVQKTKCLITTLGPYARYGEFAFKACAEAGTHYLDCTGEVPWTLAMIKKYEAAAKASGAMMFPQNGLESAPSDLLTWAVVSTIRSKLSAPTGDVILSLHQLDSAPTGGTVTSLLGMFDAFPTKDILHSMKPYALSPVPNNHPAPKKSFAASATGVTNVPGLGLLSTSPTGAMNAAVVFRTWGLTAQEPRSQEDFYGPKFSYQELMKPPNALAGLAIHYGFLLGTTIMLLPPARALVRKFSFKPGEGPDLHTAKNDRIELRAVAKPDVQTETNKQAFGSLLYTGSMYYLTAALLAQGAATILEDENARLTGGVYTASCLGQGYIDRLQKVDVQIETGIRDM